MESRRAQVNPGALSGTRQSPRLIVKGPQIYADGPAMLEGLPPNNAAHVMRVTLDEARARAVADLMVESFEPAEAASTAFETETPWPGGGKAWAVEVYFGFEPDEEGLRELVAAAAGEDAAALVSFGVTEKQDWVANALAGL